MMNLVAIAAGGALGALLRYGCSSLAGRMLGDAFPWGTLIVNLSGCLLIGMLWAISERSPLTPRTSAFLFTGVLGSFTTFSTYGLESFHLLREGQIFAGIGNIVLSNGAGLVLVVAGYLLGRGMMGEA